MAETDYVISVDEPEQPATPPGKFQDTPQPLVEVLSEPAPRVAWIVAGVLASVLIIALVCSLLQCIGLWSDRAAEVVTGILGLAFVLGEFVLILMLLILRRRRRLVKNAKPTSRDERP